MAAIRPRTLESLAVDEFCDDDVATPKLHKSCDEHDHSLLASNGLVGNDQENSGDQGRKVHFAEPGTPTVKRERSVVNSPFPTMGVPAKRQKERVLGQSYTDVNCMNGSEVRSNFQFPLQAFGDPDDIDGMPLIGESVSPPKTAVTLGPSSRPSISDQRSATLSLPSRTLLRRATDQPMPPPSPVHVPSPRSAAAILEQVFGTQSSSFEDPVIEWKKRREESKCPLCLGILIRPVDVTGCGHYVCRTHVIDIYQHGGSKTGIRCPVCRKEDNVCDFNKIEVDGRKWAEIQRAKFHSKKRRSASPSRSLTPLRDRFNRKFLQDVDF